MDTTNSKCAKRRKLTASSSDAIGLDVIPPEFSASEIDMLVQETATNVLGTQQQKQQQMHNGNNNGDARETATSISSSSSAASSSPTHHPANTNAAAGVAPDIDVTEVPNLPDLPPLFNSSNNGGGGVGGVDNDDEMDIAEAAVMFAEELMTGGGNDDDENGGILDLEDVVMQGADMNIDMNQNHVNNSSDTVADDHHIFGGDEIAKNNEKSSTGKETKKKNTEKQSGGGEIQINDRVYCRWPENNEWYWGKITGISRNNGKVMHCSVRFDDGDFLPKAAPADFVTEKVYYSQPKHHDTTLAIELGYSCGKCTMCSRDPCKKCHACLTDSTSRCFQKMCCRVHDNRKGLAAPFFPDKWRFVFLAEDDKRAKQFKNDPVFAETRGLVLLAPVGNRRYPSVERAMYNQKSVLQDVNLKEFYRYVGLDIPSPHIEVNGRIKALENKIKRTESKIKRTESQKAKRRDPPAAPQHNLILVNSDLGVEDAGKVHRSKYLPMPEIITVDASWASAKAKSEGACGSCVHCQRPPCGICHACKIHSNVQCFQKMCLQKAEEEKAIPAPSFPEGWRFIFQNDEKAAQRHKINGALAKNAGFSLLAPVGNRKYYSVENALQVMGRSLSCVNVIAFKNYVGLLDASEILPDGPMAYLDYLKQKDLPMLGWPSGVTTIPDHPLIGREFLWSWIDANRRPQSVYGKVAQCHRGQDGFLRFSITYEENTRQLATLEVAEFENYVPTEIEGLVERQVWGGCHLAMRTARDYFNPKANLVVPTYVSCFNWNVPQAVQDAMVEVDGHPGVLLARRTIIFRGFELVFQAKKSGIPNAGYGVWLKCRPVSSYVESARMLTLEAGDMLDFGVYSPLAKSDRRPEHISVIKNFIHYWECESYNFDVALHEIQEDTANVLDITDDITGSLHDKARQSVLPYVNETDGYEFPTVHAEHDPSGAVHYLLGHYEQWFGPFSLPVGEEVEIKVDYGHNYEKVRVRKGYPRVNEVEQERFMKENMQDDMETVLDTLDWTAKEVADVVGFLVQICSDLTVFPEMKGKRILVVTLLLRARALAILKELDEDPELTGTPTQSYLTRERAVESEQKTKDLIPKICSFWWEAAHSLSSALRSEEVLKVGLMHALKCDDEQLDLMNPEALSKRILDL